MLSKRQEQASKEKGKITVMFKNKIAVVTGAGGTLCSEIAIELAKAGATVFLVGRTEEKLICTAEKIQRTGGVPARVFPCDVTSYEDTTTDDELTASDYECISHEDKASSINENVSPQTPHTGIMELSRLLEKIKNDDLLLLTLILLFAKDGGDEGMDGIILLALLLLFR